MRIKNKKTYYLKASITTKNSQGKDITSYGEPQSIEANIYPATGKVQAEMYGMRLAYIMNMLYDGQSEIHELDGICVYVGKNEKPDYKVISIKRYTSHMLLELEKII